MENLDSDEAKARKVYELYWESYLNGDISLFESTLGDIFEMIGTSESEICHSKAEGIQFLRSQKTEIVGKVEMRNRQVDVVTVDRLKLFNEVCDIYVLTDTAWDFYSKIRISTWMRETKEGWKVIQQHGSLPDMRVQEGETLAIQKISKENLQLRDAVKRRTAELENKNRELAIEKALEKVRAVAMGMKKPGDMLDVCRVISDQLQDFGVNKIRNVQIAIIDENIGQYGCYQYFTLYDQIAVEKTAYLKSPVEHGMVKQMLASRDGYFIGSLSDQELEEFRSHRKEENHFPDPHLDDTRELAYCFLSIGEGGLGLTLYQPMDDETLTLFRRFHQVFSLAYQRFRDIQKAEAQAREAQIEAALERVRAQTMAMHNSEDVGKCIVKMFGELTALGVDEGTRFGIGILNHDNENNQLWTARKNGDEVNMHIGNLDMTWHPLLISARKAWKEQVTLHKYVLEGEDLVSYYEMLNKAPDYKIQVAIENLPEREFHYGFVFEHGFFYAFSPREFHSDLIHITHRFSSQFAQTYQRYLDLVKAEGQAREAQIEAALERVRSRSLAMHKSEELEQVILVVSQQLQQLQFKFDNVSFGFDTEQMGLKFWLASPHLSKPFLIQVPYIDNPAFNRPIQTRKNGVNFNTDILSREENLQFLQHMFDYSELHHIPAESKNFLLGTPGFARSQSLMKNTILTVGNYVPAPYSQEQNVIIKRFGNVFEQAYVRFLDLQKAEAQAKEAQIEAALERVRSRTMAMQSSTELSAVAAEFFAQMNQLVTNLWTCGFVLCEKDRQEDEWWLSMDGDFTRGFFLPNVGDYAHATLYEGWLKGEALRSVQLEGETLQQHYDWLMEIPVSRAIFEEMDAAGLARPDWQKLHAAYFSKGYLVLITREPCGKEEIFRRFAQVFDQTYTRFLDLKKAEAQAIEAQIEAALERVRSRSMAMHKSEELQEVVDTVFDNLIKLKVNTDTATILIPRENSNDIEVWIQNVSRNYSSRLLMPYFENSVISRDFFQCREKKTELFYKHYSKEEKDEWFYLLFNHPESLMNIPEDRKNFVLNGPSYSVSVSFQSKSGLYMGRYDDTPYSEIENDILKRFAKVFEQTYTRFLDLQKAEAQTRESKIEAALEKIRARTMGMQSSEELPEVANLMFLEVQALGIPAWSCGYNILSEDKTSSICIMSSEGTLQRPFPLPLTGEASFIEWYQYLQSQELFFTQELGGKAIDDHYNYMTSLPELEPIFKDIEDAGLSLPTYQINHLCKFTNGFLLFITYEKVPESHDIFKRFTNVFDQTYTRFLDLKKAEAQAREAQIENALEKMRSRSLAMQSPDELIEVAQLLREEMGALGVEELETSSIYIHDDNDDSTQCWFTIKNSENPGKAITDQMTLDLQQTWVGRKMAEFYRSKANQTSIQMHGEQRIEWIRYCEKKSDLFGTSNFYGETIPNRTYHLYKFSNGYIGAAAPGEISKESWELLKRATGVFSFAYTRFRDLQMAEASARASMRQASLDRVRADISSMRNADDLGRITPLIFHELNTLGIPFIRCGVFIMHEKEENVEIYLSTPEGKSLAAMTLPFGANEMTARSVEAWKRREIFIQHWDQADFINWSKSLHDQGYVQDLKTYQGAGSAPESLHLHFVPFDQGLLYIGSTQTLSGEQIDLVKALVKSFAIAYARYEDFVRLEQAKVEVESAMRELKATQSQLVQQEKLASLGHLTAGIAHEIKNPLNFVNNFSEVSIELLAEALEERNKSHDLRDETLLDEILADIKFNLEKVYEHGTRANGIVTAMLQHSRGGSGKKELTQLNSLIKEYVNLSYHGMRAGKNPINVDIDLGLEAEIREVPLIKEDFTRVVINLCNNAFDAMREKVLKSEDRRPKTEVGDSGNLKYEPNLKVSTSLENGQVRISFEDNGPGIPEEIRDKILQPFFTTKKGTEGTGLGLSITHDIVKAHGGELEVETSLHNGTKFIIKLHT